MKNIAFALMIGLGASTAAIAADFSQNPYGALLGNYVSVDKDRDGKHGYGGSAILGLPLTKWANLEFTVFGDSINRQSGNYEDHQTSIGADFMVPLAKGAVRPFLLIGGGAVRDQLEQSANTLSTNPYVEGGGGLLVALTDRLSLRGEGRYFVDFNDSSYPGKDTVADIRVGLGVQYAFGQPPAPPALPKAVTPPPVTPPPPPPPPPPPVDSDGDGVFDPQDKCPGTPKGFKVDADGCIIEQTIVLKDVNFEYNKFVLTAEAKSILDAILPGLTAQPMLTLEIGGHTDSKGADAYNKLLSKKRADTVRTYLISKGVAAERLAAVGYGESKPIADNKTDAGRAENRRVELQVLNKPLTVKIIKK